MSEIIELTDPKFIQDGYNQQPVLNQTLEMLLGLNQSDLFQAPIAISQMLDKSIYDVTNPEQFVHFGSLSTRLQVFKQKYIELYDKLNLPQNIQKQDIRSMISTFDRYQRFLLFDGNLLFQDSGQTKIISYQNPIFETWYKNAYAAALAFDKKNIHRLINLLPEGVANDQRNKDLLLFAELLGNSIDQYWSAIKALPKLTNKLEHELQTHNVEFLKFILQNYGIGFNMKYSSDSIINFYKFFLNQENVDINAELYNKRLLSRLIANIPFLLRAKGTEDVLKQILKIYGLTQDLIRISKISHYQLNVQNEFQKIRVTKPYYRVSDANRIEINRGGTNTFLLYCRFPYELGSHVVDNIIERKSFYKPEKPYLFHLQNNLLNVFEDGVFLYSENITLPQQITLSNPLYVDNIKLIQTSYDYSDFYRKGSNVFHLMNQIKGIYDFNRSGNIVVKTSEGLQMTYNSDGIELGSFEVINYHSIFPTFTSPVKNYEIDNIDDLPILELAPHPEAKGQSKEILPTILIGANQSDRINSYYMIPYDSLSDLLDTTEYLDQRGWSSTKYKRLQEYKKEMNQYYDSLIDEDVPSYQTKVKFYQQLDGGLFKLMQKFLPVNVTPHIGVILDNDIFTRNRIPTRLTPIRGLGYLPHPAKIDKQKPSKFIIDFEESLKAKIKRCEIVKYLFGQCRTSGKTRIKDQSKILNIKEISFNIEGWFRTPTNFKIFDQTKPVIASQKQYFVNGQYMSFASLVVREQQEKQFDIVKDFYNIGGQCKGAVNIRVTNQAKPFFIKPTIYDVDGSYRGVPNIRVTNQTKTIDLSKPSFLFGGVFRGSMNTRITDNMKIIIGNLPINKFTGTYRGSISPKIDNQIEKGVDVFTVYEINGVYRGAVNTRVNTQIEKDDLIDFIYSTKNTFIYRVSPNLRFSNEVKYINSSTNEVKYQEANGTYMRGYRATTKIVNQQPKYITKENYKNFGTVQEIKSVRQKRMIVTEKGLEIIK